jgi:hypothetical protein
MRLALALVAVGFACTLSVEADARAGRGFKGGSRSSSPASVPQAQPSPRVGVGVGVVVPLGTGRSSTTPASQPGYALPLPPRPAEQPDGPKFYSASAEAASTERKAEPSRPWCHNGEVVGRGAGFCELTLAAERRDAPALLALSN